MRITFKYDGVKPRSTVGYKEAENYYRKFSGHHKLPDDHQMHHVNWDRADGRSENLFICENQQEHDNLHGQMIQFVSECIDSDVLKFDRRHKEYYVEDTHLQMKILHNRFQYGMGA